MSKGKALASLPVIIAFSLFYFSQFSALSQDSPTSRFLGQWANVNSKTGSVTRIDIRQDNDRIIVHMWGRCHPKECDWGKAIANIQGKDNALLSVTWNFGFSIKTQELRLLYGSKLELSTHTHFIDKSKRNDYDTKEYFLRGLSGRWRRFQKPVPVPCR